MGGKLSFLNSKGDPEQSATVVPALSLPLPAESITPPRQRVASFERLLQSPPDSRTPLFSDDLTDADDSNLPTPKEKTPKVDSFAETLSSVKADDIAKKISDFIIRVQNADSDPELTELLNKPTDFATAVKLFMKSMMDEIERHTHWNNSSEKELHKTQESMERYILDRIYQRAFKPTAMLEEQDVLLHKRNEQIKHLVTPESLDIHAAYRNDIVWSFSQKELSRINQARAPRDKMTCVLKSVVILMKLINLTSSQKHKSGADDFLPLFIYIVLQANPPQLLANIDYIDRYLSDKDGMSRAGYVLTSISAVCAFLQNLDVTVLKTEGRAVMRTAGLSPTALTPSSRTSQTLEFQPTPLTRSLSSDKT
eukprot:GILJ01008583.1.p1 GENE.GILJ01008583.1~~GILJ01008583.1.p1  ORF type:complete len:367 (-),score=58.22 GILJ01008583.1:505-1605(-)